jgi:hypothetical protein
MDKKDCERVIEQCKQAIDTGEAVEDYKFYYRVLNLLKYPWIKTEVELPARRVHVLCRVAKETLYDDVGLTENYYICEGFFETRSKGWYVARNPDMFAWVGNVTHWMPLPEDPDGGQVYVN